MHELAHLILKHVPARVDVSKTGLLLLSEYSDQQESEADWLAAAILLPRDALVLHRGAALPLQKSPTGSASACSYVSGG
jgi:Zn-dependent peptidase ImmA (M78 family)